jgi:sugar transferase EpsL
MHKWQLEKHNRGLYRKYGKRLMDLALTVPALVLLSPVIAVVTLLVRLRLGTPVFFLQPRTGQHGRPFTLVKFRTMTDARDAEGNLLPSIERLTRFGQVLRSTSLDELPTLLNILRGQMSLVGPRPLLLRYLDRYSPEQMRRHEVMPGITGWAQINGRNALSWEEKFALDVWYVEHQSLWLDVRILAVTARIILKRQGISPGNRAIMPEFTGTNRNG